jgi:hypothetical protein
MPGAGSISGSVYRKGLKYGFDKLVLKGIREGESACFHTVSRQI